MSFWKRIVFMWRNLTWSYRFSFFLKASKCSFSKRSKSNERLRNLMRSNRIKVMFFFCWIHFLLFVKREILVQIVSKLYYKNRSCWGSKLREAKSEKMKCWAAKKPEVGNQKLGFAILGIKMKSCKWKLNNFLASKWLLLGFCFRFNFLICGEAGSWKFCHIGMGSWKLEAY